MFIGGYTKLDDSTVRCHLVNLKIQDLKDLIGTSLATNYSVPYSSQTRLPLAFRGNRSNARTGTFYMSNWFPTIGTDTLRTVLRL